MYLVITCVCVYAPVKVNAQCGTPHIINDKDGYTNVRKAPNGKSEIVGKMYKHEVFVSQERCGGEDEDEIIYSDKWLKVWNDKTSGYIYKENVLRLDNLPFLKYTDFPSSIVPTNVYRNDSISVTVEITPFDTIANSASIYGVADLYFENDAYFAETKQSREIYNPDNKINKIEVNYKGKKLLLTDKLQNHYYNYHGYDSYYRTSVNIGSDGELYIGFSGGVEGAVYHAWITIFNGEVIQEFVCW